VSERWGSHLVDEGTRFDASEESAAALLVELLGDAPTWSEPSSALEDAVVGTVRTACARRRWSHRLVRRATAAATAVAAACALVVGLTAQHDARPELRGRLTADGSLPGAAGSAEVYRSRSGFRVALDAKGLPELRAGRYYEAWLADVNGRDRS
jgi:hypothetical protein